jgi:spore coat polysaccharide biosynthesis predicted glycosyltransferase SpsG
MSKKKILFIVSSSEKTGFGHLRRCSILSRDLKDFQRLLIIDSKHFIDKKIKSLFKNIFIIKDLTNKNIKNLIVQINPDFIIFDTFVYNFNLFKFFSKKKIISLQFVNNDYKFNIFADYLINSSPLPKKLNKFIINKKISKLEGVRYSILDTNKISFKKKILKLNKKEIVQVFMCLGGNFKISNLNKLVIFFSELKYFKFNLFFKEDFKKNHLQIKKLIKNQKNVSIMFNKDNILKYARKTKFAIISGGTILTEMIFMQIPSIVFSLSKNQETYAIAWHKKKCCSYQGNFYKFLNKKPKDQVLLVKNFLNKDIFLINKNIKYKVDNLGSNRISKIIKRHLND